MGSETAQWLWGESVRSTEESDQVSSEPCLLGSGGLVFELSPGVQCLCWGGVRNQRINITMISISTISALVLAWGRGRNFWKRTNGKENVGQRRR